MTTVLQLPGLMDNRSRWLLATDMDGTVIPPDDSPEHRRAVDAFAAAVGGRDDMVLAYVTGRDLALAQAGIRSFGLPEPDFLACDVGTGVYARDGDGFVPDPVYQDRMQEAMGGITAERLQEVLAGLPGLRLQEDERQGPYKVSFYLDDTLDEGEGEPLVRVREILQREGARVSLVFSVDPVRRKGLLDLLPAGVAKDTAVRFLEDRAGVRADRLIYAGDSGNDRAAMLSGYRVVVVGNAPDGLKEDLRTEARQRGLSHRLYFARGECAAGVVEGLRHWGASSESG